ncbi:MAG: hypothetical protein LBE92_17045 [Chryseobacterium sp.]|jgi:hypothetical protein|uniref:hypothetical protein n=1 Tax=Chryseobacterium sp. TaxID=1871047 RepID=UPI00282F4716|nr:hypothetical protein [Chryseobacterium sp.]MDR2237832.1 hypothetical protein [Chryseobacterium sp.]
MGLFDLFKKKEKPQPKEQAAQKEPEPYLGDLDKTSILSKLVQTPPAERDDKWQQTFLENIGHASFRCGDPQVVTGPDGFPYFQLFLPEPNQPFQCYVIDNMKDDFLLSSGLGVVINPTETRADWVLSYGDILNYHLSNSFYTTTATDFSHETSNETVTEDEKVMVGQPSEIILPEQTRKLLAEFLTSNGMITPKILLMMRQRKDGAGVSQDLVFNVTPHHFKDENTYRSIMQAIGWYLPRHYSYVGMGEDTLGTDFMPL